MGPVVSNANESTISSIDVRINGGIHKSEKYMNSTVRFNNLKIDGNSFGSPEIRFKISQNPGKQVSYALILSSSKTMLNINKNNNGGGGRDRDSGYKLWIKSRMNIDLSRVSNDFSQTQIKALKSMCGYFTTEESVNKNIKTILEKNSSYYEESVSRLVSKRAYREFKYLATRCKKSLDSKLDGYDTIKIYQPPKLCGKKVSPLLDLNKKTLKDVQKSLKELGFYNSSIDGLFGAGSCKALKSYYSEKNKNFPIIFSKLSVRMLLKDADDTLNKSKEEEKKASALEEEEGSCVRRREEGSCVRRREEGSCVRRREEKSQSEKTTIF
jgi:hypothetical protein